MKIIEYADLDTSKVKRQYGKLVGFLEKDDFYSAEVKKLAEGTNRVRSFVLTFHFDHAIFAP